MVDMRPVPEPGKDNRSELLELYDSSLPYVYGYLLSRSGAAHLAEELTSETFLAAADAVLRDPAPPLSTGWLVGVARHKLVDYWRRQAREERGLRLLGETASSDDDSDIWNVHLDAMRARAVLETLAPHHRAALTPRYLDDLPVSEVAELMDRSVLATEALLVRARSAFRRAYSAEESSDV